MWRGENMEKRSEKEVLAQWRKLQKDCDIRRPMNKQNLILWARAGIYTAPEGGGGWGRQKKFAPETAAEIFAAVNLIDGLRMTLAQIRTARELALLLESAPNFTPENSLAEIRRLSDAFAGKEFYAAGVIGWLRSKTLGLRYLYDIEMTERQKFFETDAFKLFVLGLTAGFYRGYSVNEKREAVKPAEAPEPKDALETFAVASDEQPPMSAKARE
jgi:hypothetical protein